MAATHHRLRRAPQRTALRTVLAAALVAALLAAARAQSPLDGGGAGPAASAEQLPAPPGPAPAWRALWVDNGTLARAGGRAGVARLMAEARAAGVSAVLVEALYRGYTLYPGPLQDPRVQGWGEDPLQVVVEEARRQGLEVHGWLWALPAGIHGEMGPVLRMHPEWADQDAEGNLFAVASSGMPWLDPSRPEVRQFLAEQAVYLASRYGVDGIHLDYVRYPDQWRSSFAHSPHAVQAFEQATGIRLQGRSARDLSPGELEAWQRWREEQVGAVVAAVREALRRAAPRVVLSGAVIPELTVARWLYLQDWRRWLAEDLVDFVVLMAYTSSAATLRDMLRSLDTDLAELAAWRDPQALRRRVAVGLALYAAPAPAIAEQLRVVQEAGLNAVAIFAAAYFGQPVRELLARWWATGSGESAPGPGVVAAAPPAVPWLAPAPLRALQAAQAAAPSDAGPPPQGNLARSAQVRVDSSYPGYGPGPLNDGVRNDVLEVGRWAEVAWASAERPGEHWIELRWPQAVRVERVDVYWALDRGRYFPSRALRLEFEDEEGRWHTLWEYAMPEAGHDLSRTSFSTRPVATRAVRLVQPDGQGPAGRPLLMWVAEVEVYGTPLSPQTPSGGP